MDVGLEFNVSYKETLVLKWNSKFLPKFQTLDLTFNRFSYGIFCNSAGFAETT